MEREVFPVEFKGKALLFMRKTNIFKDNVFQEKR